MAHQPHQHLHLHRLTCDPFDFVFNSNEHDAILSAMDPGHSGAAAARDVHAEPQDAPGRPLASIGFVPGLGDTHVEAASVVIAQRARQYELAEPVLVGDDAAVDPYKPFVDRVGDPAAAVLVEA